MKFSPEEMEYDAPAELDPTRWVSAGRGRSAVLAPAPRKKTRGNGGLAIDAADIDASKPVGPTFRGVEEWKRFLSFKRGYAKLDPKVRQAFPDDTAVNAALRKVLELQEMKHSTGRKRKSA